MATMRGITGGSIGVAVLGGLIWVMATSDGPWDRTGGGGSNVQKRDELEIRTGMDRTEIPRPDWVVKSASIGRRADERREGLTINHRVLELRAAVRPERVLPGGSTLIYTPHPELEEKVNGVLDGDTPVSPGMEAMFAIGRLADVRMVRLDGQGKVASIEDARVSFVTVTRTPQPGER